MFQSAPSLPLAVYGTVRRGRGPVGRAPGRDLGVPCYSPQGRKELDTTEATNTYTHTNTLICHFW